MTTVLLVRHGRTSANSAGVLAGWTPGIGLDEVGTTSAMALGERVRDLPLAAVITSPLQRCTETAAQLVRARPREQRPPVHRDKQLGEVRYGDWTGGELKTLAKDPLWTTVQAHPSAVTFPGEGGESLAGMQARAVAAVRRWNRRLGADAVFVVVSHGDVIKAVLADALGLHLDAFQRIVVNPASLSVVQYTNVRPFVERINDTGGDISRLKPVPPRRRRRARVDAVVGGGA